MAEQEIKRVYFFDGQFLKQGEFIDEQVYHKHMRRRINYTLFDQSGIVRVNADDLELEITNAAAKQFKVKAGMAISRNSNTMEGKEIILKEDINDNWGGSSGTEYVTIHYQKKAPDSAALESEGIEDHEFRTMETAFITVHTSPPPYGPAPNGEEYILLGAIDCAAPGIDHSGRKYAKINSLLINGAGPGPAIPTITGIEPHTGSSAAPIAAVISGTNLDGASGVTFSGTGVTAAFLPGAVTPTTIPVLITIAVGAAVGPRTFEVKFPSGDPVSSGSITFSVVAETVTPTITGIEPHTGSSAAPIAAVISGTNLDGASGVTFSGTGVTAAIQPGANSITIPILITIAVGASEDERTFTVTTPSGTASSEGVPGEAAAFSVIPAPVPAPVFVSNITGVTNTEFNPNGGPKDTSVSIYGKHFLIDTTMPQVELVDTQGNVLHEFDVVDVKSKTVAAVKYHIIKAKVGTVSQDKPTDGKIRITTKTAEGEDGGAVVSTAPFVIFP